MRLPRFRVRTLMAAVVVVALLISGTTMGLRSYSYDSRARAYALQAQHWRENAVRDRANPASSRTVAAVWGLQIAEYFEPLARKYRRAAWRPWLPVAPDPPVPVFGSP